MPFKDKRQKYKITLHYINKHLKNTPIKPTITSYFFRKIGQLSVQTYIINQNRRKRCLDCRERISHEDDKNIR